METPRRLQQQHKKQELGTPLEIPPSPYMKNIGYGTGVKVYRLERSPKCGIMRSPWAVKKVTEQGRKVHGAIFDERMREEAKLLRTLEHPNIVGFRGMLKTADGSVNTLALECCGTSLGSMLEERYDEQKGPLPSKHTLKMVEDIGRALDYLHTGARILHGDVKSFNVLVKGDFEICKLCDFGVSLPLNEEGIVITNDPEKHYIGTGLWSAPEVIQHADVIDFKADIFSFGLVIYETLTLVPPHTLDFSIRNSDKEDSICITPNDTIDEDYSDEEEEEEYEEEDSRLGTRPVLPHAFELSEEYNPIVELFYLCTNNLAEDRPMARVIWQSVAGQSIIKNVNN